MAAPQSSTRMAYDHRDAWTTIAATVVALTAAAGGLFGQLLGWWSWQVAAAGCAAGLVISVWLVVGALSGYVADTASLRAVAHAEELARHDTAHARVPERSGWLVSRLARLRCPTGHGHCVHPGGDEAMTDVVFTDTGVEHVDRGGWCCGCPARWRFTPIDRPVCRVCQGTR